MNDPLSYKIIGCALEVFKTLGPGLLESIYKKALIEELRINDLDAISQVPVPVIYKGQRYRGRLAFGHTSGAEHYH